MVFLCPLKMLGSGGFSGYKCTVNERCIFKVMPAAKPEIQLPRVVPMRGPMRAAAVMDNYSLNGATARPIKPRCDRTSTRRLLLSAWEQGQSPLWRS